MIPFVNYAVAGWMFAFSALLAGCETHLDAAAAHLQPLPPATVASGRNDCGGAESPTAQRECGHWGPKTAQEMWNFALQNGDGFGNEAIVKDASYSPR